MIASSEYLIGNNYVYSNLNEYIDDFADEAELIETAKCELINYGSLSDMTLSGGIAYVSEESDGYSIEYKGKNYCLTINQVERTIIDYTIA